MSFRVDFKPNDASSPAIAACFSMAMLPHDDFARERLCGRGRLLLRLLRGLRVSERCLLLPPAAPLGLGHARGLILRLRCIFSYDFLASLTLWAFRGLHQARVAGF